MRKKGFTLIELLVVIAIIALLLSILMPALSKVKDQARVVICATRQRQNIFGATLAANDNNGNIPKGGFNFENLNFDDAISFRAEEYLNLCSYIVGEGGGVDTSKSLSVDELKDAADEVVNSDARLNFVCPSLESFQTEMNPSGLLFTENTSMPFIHQYGSAGWTARIGYVYLGGFETDRWDWMSIKNTATEGKKWKSPDKTTDSGNLVLIADRYRYCPTLMTTLLYTHGDGGWGNGDIGNATSVLEVQEKYSKFKVNVGRLDGSVESSRLNNLDAHHVTSQDNTLWGHTGPDYYFF